MDARTETEAPPQTQIRSVLVANDLTNLRFLEIGLLFAAIMLTVLCFAYCCPNSNFCECIGTRVKSYKCRGKKFSPKLDSETGDTLASFDMELRNCFSANAEGIKQKTRVEI